MERKIGEIFEYNGEWYQTVKSQGKCCSCDFMIDGHCIVDFSSNESCFYCHRKDKENVIFKKLEKVGEQFLYKGKQMQSYRRATDALICNWNNRLLLLEHRDSDIIDIEIKQTKEDMEENKLNLKPFDIQKAREGKPVCTRDGHKARIICFDYNGETGDYPIVALVHYNKGNKCYERVLKYTSDGLFNKYGDCQHDDDLMMLPEKRVGWININKDASLFKSREEAERNCTKDYATVRVEFEI